MFQDSVDFVDMEFKLSSTTSMEKQIMYQNGLSLTIELKRFGLTSKARRVLLLSPVHSLAKKRILPQHHILYTPSYYFNLQHGWY